MTDSGGSENRAAGGPIRHVPVLLGEVLDALHPLAGACIVDGTFGAGGYTRAILESGADVIAIDRDPDAIQLGSALVERFGERLRLIQDRFARMDSILEDRLVDGVVLDIGVSSMQLDQAERGFSFQTDGPLDMRMSQSGPSAADVVNRLKVGDLTRVIGILGEERQAGRIARAIEARRDLRPFERTLDLAQLVGKVVGRAPTDRIDPATRTFQALRIFVNNELGQLARGLVAAERVLKPGGRLAVVTFHSLEDRIAKRFLRNRGEAAAGSRHLPGLEAPAATFEPERKARKGSDAEIASNPRARSAKLRVATRTAVPARSGTESFFELPSLADLPQSGA